MKHMAVLGFVDFDTLDQNAQDVLGDDDMFLATEQRFEVLDRRRVSCFQVVGKRWGRAFIIRHMAPQIRPRGLRGPKLSS